MSDTPSRYWRAILRIGVRGAPADDQAFLATCERYYLDDKRRLAEAGARLGVYLMGLVLLTYGRLDAIDDVLENMPEPRQPTNRALSGAVDALFPLPSGLRASTAPLDVLAWIRAHRTELAWDDVSGRFVLG